MDGEEHDRNQGVTPPPGRASESAVIATANIELTEGRGSTTLIAGEPGIGKTTLAHHAVALAPAADAAWGRCINGGAAAVLGPWTQVLRDLCEHHELDQIRSWVGSSVELAQLLPSLTIDSTVRPSEDRLDLFDGVARFLRRRAAESPLLLLFEDVHWADSATVELISFAAGALTEDPVSFVVTWRDTDLSVAPVDAIEELGRARRSNRIELTGLSAEVIEELLNASTDSDSDGDTSEIANAVHQRTNGNPLFVNELLGLIAGTPLETSVGKPDSANPGEVASLPLTTGIQDAIRRRVKAVGPHATEVLSILAVVDDYASINLIEQVCASATDLDRSTIEGVLAGAHQAGLVVESPDGRGSLRLHHALVVDTLTDDLLGFRRAQLHAEVGNALVAENASSPVLAHHFAEGATAGTGTPAASFSMDAAAAAGALYDLPRALELLDKGLAALRINKPIDRATESDVLTAMSEAHKQAGNYELVHETAQSAFEAAREIDDLPRMMAAVLSYAGRSAEGTVFDRFEWLGYWHPPKPALEMLEHVLGKLPLDDPATAQLLPRIASCRFGEIQDLDRARREFKAAVALGRDLGGPNTLTTLSMYAEFEGTHGPPSVVSQILDEILSYAPTHGAVQDLIRVHRVRAIMAADTGSNEGIGHHVAKAKEAAESYDSNHARLHATWVEIAWLIYRGDLAAAEEAITSGFTVFKRFGAAAVDALGLQYANLRREQGQHTEVEALLHMKMAGSDHEALRSAFAMNTAESGRIDEACELLDRAAGPGFALLGEPALQMTTPACWSVTAWLSGHREAAKLLFPLFDSQPPRLVSLNHGLVHFGSTSFYAGLLALTLDNLGAAEKHLGEAEKFERALGARPTLLKVLCCQRLLHELLGRPTSQTYRDEALALADELDMAWVLTSYQ